VVGGIQTKAKTGN